MRAAQGLKRWAPAEGMQGSVVFIGSISSQGNRGQISYASTKAGLEGAAATIMKEAMYYGVRCSVIHPGFTDTPMLAEAAADVAARTGGDAARIKDKYAAANPMGRLIVPDEVAAAVAYLCSPAAAAVTGTALTVAGGEI